jgi:hypothetical protein
MTVLGRTIFARTLASVKQKKLTIASRVVDYV